MATCQTIFLKLGGSVITDKHREAALERENIVRLGAEIADALGRRNVSLLLGHGAGSFGHVPAARHNVKAGIPGGSTWKGHWLTRRAVMELNNRVIDALAEGGLEALAVQPSASAIAHDGRLKAMDTQVIKRLLAEGQTPLIFGDVVLDEVRTFTIISTEGFFAFLARALRPERIILACDVEGVFTADPTRASSAELIREIDARTGPKAGTALSASAAVDVTGGMAQKVARLCEIVRDQPQMRVHIVSGLTPGVVRRAILGKLDGGTVIQT